MFRLLWVNTNAGTECVENQLSIYVPIRRCAKYCKLFIQLIFLQYINWNSFQLCDLNSIYMIQPNMTCIHWAKHEYTDSFFQCQQPSFREILVHRDTTCQQYADRFNITFVPPISSNNDSMVGLECSQLHTSRENGNPVLDCSLSPSRSGAQNGRWGSNFLR